MKTRLIRIGNSRGVRLAKPLLEQAGLEDEVDIRVEPGAVIITAAVRPRAGWAAAVAKHGPAELLDAPSATEFDDRAWEWR
ncbi:MAG: AbrB/MazE/SpoVT family DNA-binding domain-containing protein [Gemmatimonadaceae bacterium]